MTSPREVLEWEIQWTGHQAVKQPAIEVRFGITLTRYTQLLNEALDDPVLLEAHPQDVHRLRSIRGDRVAARESRVFTQPRK